MTTCLEDCPNEVVARGLCVMHYQRWYKHGDPNTKGNRWGLDKDAETKVCADCNQDLPVGAFYKRKDNNGCDGRPLSRCIRCYLKVNKNRRLMREFGITLDQYEQLLAEQGGVCAICKSPPPGRRLMPVDHDHDTGVVRGILCHFCNIGLGMFKDNPKSLSAAIIYLAALAAEPPTCRLWREERSPRPCKRFRASVSA